MLGKIADTILSQNESVVPSQKRTKERIALKLDFSRLSRRKQEHGQKRSKKKKPINRFLSRRGVRIPLLWCTFRVSAETPQAGSPRRSVGYFALPFPCGSLGKASRPLAARARGPFASCIYKGAPSGYPPKPRKRGPLGGASDASRCRFPSGASAKRRGRWPLARTLVSCIYKYAPSGYPPKPRKRDPLGGASDALHPRANPPGSRPCRHTKKEAQV